MYARIRPRRGTKGQFEAVNPVLKEGEMAIETDDNGTGKGLVNIKFGDGVTDYKNLPYAVRGKDISDTPAVFEDDVEFIEDEEILSGMVAGKIFKLIKKKLSLLTAELANALSIAQGKNRSHVFQTEVQLDEWLSNADNVATLKIGDNLYIVELNVPDYWWDGTQKQKLETVKVDLNEYYTKEEVDTKDQNIIGMLSDEFSTEKTYAIGELFIYNNKIYKVTSAIEYPGEFDLDYVEEVTLSSALNSSLTFIQTTTNVSLSVGINDIELERPNEKAHLVNVGLNTSANTYVRCIFNEAITETGISCGAKFVNSDTGSVNVIAVAQWVVLPN